MNTHVVLKKLPGPAGELLPGTEVDASEWRTTPLLVSQRYLKPLDAVAEPDGQTQSQSFDERVIAAIKNDIQSNGELAQLLTQIAPRARGKRSQPKEA